MLQVIIVSLLLLAEVGFCLWVLNERAEGKHPVLCICLAVLAMLAFFLTVGFAMHPECSFVDWHIVCTKRTI